MSLSSIILLFHLSTDSSTCPAFRSYPPAVTAANFAFASSFTSSICLLPSFSFLTSPPPYSSLLLFLCFCSSFCPSRSYTFIITDHYLPPAFLLRLCASWFCYPSSSFPSYSFFCNYFLTSIHSLAFLPLIFEFSLFSFWFYTSRRSPSDPVSPASVRPFPVSASLASVQLFLLFLQPRLILPAFALLSSYLCSFSICGSSFCCTLEPSILLTPLRLRLPLFSPTPCYSWVQSSDTFST